MAKRKSKSPIEGRWEIVSMTEWDFGRGWAIVQGDELTGMIFFHQGEETGFVAKRVKEKPKLK